MEEIETEFRDIIAQVRTHLEYLKALGVTHVEIAADEALSAAAAPPAGKPSLTKEAAPVQRAAIDKQPAPFPNKKPGRPAAGGPARPEELEAVRRDSAACAGCGLGKDRKAIVFGEGSPRADVLFVGGAPGAEEEKLARPFVDAAGHLLTDIIVKGMQLRREDVYITTAVKCRTPEGRDPEPGELESCAKFLARQIDAIRPKIIVALGGAAAQALLQKGRDIDALRGTWHEYHGIPVMPTLEPAHLLANPGDKKAVWEDIKKVIAKLKKSKGRA